MSWWSRRSRPARRREEVKVSAIPTWKDQLDRLEHDPVLLGAGELWGTGGRGHRAISIERYDSRETAERDHRAVVARTTKVASVADDPLHSSPLARSVSEMPARTAAAVFSKPSADAEESGGKLTKTQSELPKSAGVDSLAPPLLTPSKSADTPRALCNALADAKNDEERGTDAAADVDGDESMKADADGNGAAEATSNDEHRAAAAAAAGEDGDDEPAAFLSSPISVEDGSDDDSGDDRNATSSSSRKRKEPTAVSDVVYPEPDVQEALNAKISIWQGDMTNLKCDAIVNAANSGLWAGGGICGAIHSRAGDALEDACRKIGYTQTGQTVITKGYRLPAKYVLHTVGPTNRDHALLESCYRTCMEVSLKNKIRTVCFCCVSTGIFGFPREAAAKVALSTVRRFLLEPHESSNGDASAQGSSSSHSTNGVGKPSEAKCDDSSASPAPSKPRVRNMDFFDRVIFCTFLDADKEIYLEWTPRLFPPKSTLAAHHRESVAGTDASTSAAASPEQSPATTDASATTHANL